MRLSDLVQVEGPAVGLGEKDKTFEWLEKGFEDRSVGTRAFKIVDPAFDLLRSDPSIWQAVRVNLKKSAWPPRRFAFPSFAARIVRQAAKDREECF